MNGGDAIGIQGTSKNIWIDHCELFAENPDTQTNKDLFDGLIDIKGQTGFITISWCYLHDQHKGGLVGASDTDLSADRKITFHHNHYNKVKLRVPMYRGSVGHFFNNYIVGATDATEIRAGTCVRVEKNYYEALHYSIYTMSDSAGSTERIDNVEVSRTIAGLSRQLHGRHPVPVRRRADGHDERREDRRSGWRGRRKDLARLALRCVSAWGNVVNVDGYSVAGDFSTGRNVRFHDNVEGCLPSTTV